MTARQPHLPATPQGDDRELRILQAIQSAMPTLLTGGAPTRDERMLEIIEGMTAETWERDKVRLLELLAGK